MTDGGTIIQHSDHVGGIRLKVKRAFVTEKLKLDTSIKEQAPVGYT